MKRLLQIPVEQWIVRLLVEPHRPLVEAEALLVAAVSDAGSLAALAERMRSPPWRLLAALADEGFVTVHADGTMTVRGDLAGLRDAARLLAAVGGSQRPRIVRATVYRDLCTGAWHSRSAVERLDASARHDETHALSTSVAPGTRGPIPGAVEDLVRAALPRVRRLCPGTPRSLLKRTRVEEVEQIEPRKAPVIFDRRELGDGWEQWLTAADASLAEVCVRAAPHLVLGRKLGAGPTSGWSRGPELAAIQQCESVARHLWHRRKDRALTTDKRLMEEIKQIVHVSRAAIATIAAEGADVLRADAARVIPGTGFDQAGAMANIFRRAERRVLLFSSFLSPEFADAVVEQIDRSLPEGAELLCIHGRASEGGVAEARVEADAYLERARAPGLRSKVLVHPSAVRTHAKVIVNDAGDAWVGSWNPLSAAPGSDVTELGLELGGVEVALALLTAVREMVEETDRPFLAAMTEALNGKRGPRPVLRPEALARVNEALDWIERWVPRRFDEQWDHALEEKLQLVRNWISDVSERPRVRLVQTNEHREALLAMVGQADHGVLIATDRIKPAGLDRQLIDVLAEQPLRVQQKVRFEVRILWGREDPAFVRAGDPDVQAAQAQLALLAGTILRSRRGPRGSFAYDLLTDRGRPMCSHAKALQIDDEWLLVTSDNVLVYGDEREASDARELGVAVEAPRQALILRGELELAHPALRADWDHTRWRVAFAESVRFCAEQDGDREVPVGRAMQDMIRRCLRPDGTRDEDLHRDMTTRLFGTGRRGKTPTEAVVRLVDLTSKNRFIDFDRSAYTAARRGAAGHDISELRVWLPSADRVWMRGG